MGTCIKFHEYRFPLFVYYYIICSSCDDLGPYRHGMRDASRVSWKYDLSMDILRVANPRPNGHDDYSELHWLFILLL